MQIRNALTLEEGKLADKMIANLLYQILNFFSVQVFHSLSLHGRLQSRFPEFTTPLSSVVYSYS